MALAAVASTVASGTAAAHAVLEHTTPHRNAVLDNGPAAITLDFNEPVEAGFGAVRLFDERGDAVETGRVRHPDGRQGSVAVDVTGGPARGIYTATYRVVSADGHPVSGGFSFGVGRPVPIGPGRGAPDVAELLDRSSSGAVAETAYGLARGVHYAALLLLVGAVFFRLAVWRAAGAPDWPRRVVTLAAVAGLGAALAAIALHGVVAAGTGLGDALDRDVIDGSLSTRTGEAWLLRSCVWFVVCAYCALFSALPSRTGTLLLGGAAAANVASLSYAGHAGTQSPGAVLVPADVIHVVAAGAWLGALALLLAAFWRTPAGEPVAAALEATTRFSRLALAAIVALTVAGTAQAWFYLGSPAALIESAYGLVLLGKVALLAAIVTVAAGNRRRVRARRPAGLRRAMLTEVALAVAVLGATAALVRLAPPEAAATGPVIRELDAGPLRVQLDIEPAEAGPNDIHLYLFDRRTGEQVDRVEEVALTAEQDERDIGPISFDIPRKGPAHYELLGAGLPVTGNWRVRIDVRVSDFDVHSARTGFRLRERR